MKKFREKVSANYQIQLRPNKDLENAFRAYETSWETERLESESNRKIYCELIDFGRLKQNSEKISEVLHVNSTTKVVNVVADDDSDGEEQEVVAVGEKPKWWTKVSVETSRPKRLTEISVREVAKAFKKGQADERITCQDAVGFGDIVDTELPILDLLELDNEIFWKRVVESKIHDILKFQRLNRDPLTNWKKIGIELKFTEFIESLGEEDFRAPETVEFINILTEKLATSIENLSIRTIKPRRRYDHKLLNPSARVVNFTSDECYHGSLEFLGRLHNLKCLELKFDPGNLGMKYERRFFQVSIVDIENISKALTSLDKLTNLSIQKSDLSQSMKIHHLLMPMRSLKHLKVLDLSFCCITSKKSGEYFNDFLSACRSLQSLELKGNKLNSEFCAEFALGMEKFQGKLDFLGLSLNPILGNGLCNIVRSIGKTENVRRLDISHCINPLHGNADECIEELITMVAKETDTIEINMRGNNFVCEDNKENFIKALNKNFEIDKILCEECGFTSYQIMKVKVLLARNKYYKENPILKKNNFTVEDEAEIEKFLTRTKHPLLLKHKRPFVPKDDGSAKKAFTFNPKTKPKDYKKLASSFGHESIKCRL